MATRAAAAPAAGRLVHSTSGPVTAAAITVMTAAPLSLTPMARPRCSVSDRSAMSAVDATLAAAHPIPTRNVPSVTDQNSAPKVTKIAPISGGRDTRIHHPLAADTGRPASRAGS